MERTKIVAYRAYMGRIRVSLCDAAMNRSGERKYFFFVRDDYTIIPLEAINYTNNYTHFTWVATLATLRSME